MNLLPIIDSKSRGGFKFSNPLSGVIYNNNQYLQQCHYNPDPQNTNILIRKQNKTKLSSRLGINHSISLHKPKFDKLQQTQNHDKKINNDNNNNHLMLNSKARFLQNQPIKLQRTIYKFPDIQIKIIDQITSYKDFIQKNLRVNFAHYFGMFFKKTLAGPLTVDLIDIVQKYLQILTSKASLDSPVDMKDYPSEYFSLKSKRAFVQRIQQLQTKKSFKPIEQMIKFYCVPTREFRESCFRDILHMIIQSLYQKFSLSKDKEYVLLDQNGRLIEDVCSIKFSTSQMLITFKAHYQRSYQQYKTILQSNLQNFKKMTFSQELKKNFRGKIAAGKFDDSKLPDEKQIIQAISRRKYAQSRLESHRSPQKSSQKFNPIKTMNNFNSKSKQKINYHRKSKSTIGQNHSLKNYSSSKIQTMSARKRAQSYLQLFEKIYAQNSIYDITFNHQNQKKLLMVVFKKQFPLFKTKTIPQINAILKAFKIDSQSQVIKFQDFCRINQVSNCKGKNQNIVQFVSKYLPFNQYGQMDKQSLAKMLNFILNDINGQQVVLQIIWSWLQKSKLIQNNVLLRNTLQSWYSRNKMAFAIIVSLVFGTNQTSWIDMAYQILV